ncbi:MAG: Gfo/Idh/MocA family oxidoreductase [Phycisphaerae bacterium]|nr:Gfo/Idh/MocA family oxidoreductase [Phycisphaerae bacterium]
MSQRITRRQFAAGAAALGAGLMTRTSVFGALGANERVRLGIIGVGNRGDQLIDAFVPHKDAEIVAVCDVFEPYIAAAKAKLGGKPTGCRDYRELLDRKDIDAIVIATPDHWHAIHCIDACNAGKDVYVEKPLSLTIGEGRRMVEVANETKRVVQVGIHRRSDDLMRQAAEAVRAGEIGHVTLATCYYWNNLFPVGIGKPADCDPPEGLDWDTWLGPSPKVPFNPNRCLYKFRWFRAYSGGQLTNFGTHYIDVIQWALGKDAPTAVVAAGGIYALDDVRDIPDTLHVAWEYEGGTLVTFTQTDCSGAPYNKHGAAMEFRGTKGTLYLSDGGFVIEPEQNRLAPFPALDPRDRAKVAEQVRKREAAMTERKARGRGTTADHARDFLDCVKSRGTCHADIETGHRSTSTTLLGNMAYDRKARLEWDAKAERVTNDAGANDLLLYAYRAPWKLP